MHYAHQRRLALPLHGQDGSVRIGRRFSIGAEPALKPLIPAEVDSWFRADNGDLSLREAELPAMARIVHKDSERLVEAIGETTMTVGFDDLGRFRETLARKEADLVQVWGKRDDITIERSPDQMDEIQYASERDLAIRNLDRESDLLRQVRTALRRIHDGSFGICIQCEGVISPRRLGAVPWAPRCIQCQESAEQDRQESTEFDGETLLHAA